MFFTKQKLFDLLQKVNEVEGVHVTSLANSSSRRDSDVSDNQQHSSAIEAIRIYKVDVNLVGANRLPRMDHVGLGKSDP